MDKIFLKRVTKTKSEDTEDVYETYSLQTASWKTTPLKQLFIPLLRTSEKNAKSNGRHKGSCWTLIIFSFEAINFEHFAQISAITKLLIKVQIWLVQSLGFKVQSWRLSTINSNPPFACVISSVWYSPVPFWLYSFAIVSSYCFASEIQELMFLSQTLTTSWHLIQFPVAYLGRPFR